MAFCASGKLVMTRERQLNLPLERGSHLAVRWIEPGVVVAMVEQVERRCPPSLGERSRRFLRELQARATTYPVVRLSHKEGVWLDSLFSAAST